MKTSQSMRFSGRAAFAVEKKNAYHNQMLKSHWKDSLKRRDLDGMGNIKMNIRD